MEKETWKQKIKKVINKNSLKGFINRNLLFQSSAIIKIYSVMYDIINRNLLFQSSAIIKIYSVMYDINKYCYSIFLIPGNDIKTFLAYYSL